MEPAAPSSPQNPSPDAKTLLAAPVESLPSVNRQRLRKREIWSVGDLLFDFPRDYQDLSDERTIAQLDEGELQSVRAVVAEASTSGGFGKGRVAILVSDGSGSLRATWFNQPFMRAKFEVGQHLLLTAKPKMRGMMWARKSFGSAAKSQPTRRENCCPSIRSPRGSRNTTCEAWLPRRSKNLATYPRKFFPRRCWRSTISRPSTRPCEPFICPKIKNRLTVPAGGLFSKSCLFCNWPFRFAVASSKKPLRHRFRSTQRSTLAYAACCPLNSPRAKTGWSAKS
ncbi:MAG: hypothetical protein GXP28_11995 [Planctomycetes bacterium]|nr:hypothetical protein [Planctomycetota bacterium]